MQHFERRVLISGGGGFLGSHLSERLLEREAAEAQQEGDDAGDGNEGGEGGDAGEEEDDAEDAKDELAHFHRGDAVRGAVHDVVVGRSDKADGNYPAPGVSGNRIQRDKGIHARGVTGTQEREIANLRLPTREANGEVTPLS